MKFRNGFVSNSSSSSFVVAFPKDLHLVNLKELLFGDAEHLTAYNDPFSTEELANQIRKDIEAQTPNHVPEDRGNDWEYDNNYPIYDTELVKSMIREHPDKDIYVFEYRDEDGAFYSTLEHGDVFKNLPHRRESHH